ncbi:MAG TPA: addiction module protein [Tepidisphaeraceae bacterium]|jgi:putative addiction module component (TIGR02574 family)|nr:addiction module protein [Tepidisphaeraceae bacterium]
MPPSLLKSALKLSKSERILLVEQIWDSLAREQDAPELTDAQKKELERRLDRFKRTGPLGSSWTQVKKRLRQRRS